MLSSILSLMLLSTGVGAYTTVAEVPVETTDLEFWLLMRCDMESSHRNKLIDNSFLTIALLILVTG